MGNVANEKSWLVDDKSRVPLFRELDHAYDSFGRLRETIYRSGAYPEIVGYRYDSGGNLFLVTSQPFANPEHVDVYVDSIKYDEFEQRTRMKYSNGVETRYAYDPLTRRLTGVSSDLNNAPLQRLSYHYDKVGNISEAGNDVPVPASGGSGFGPVKQSFEYDDLYQLTSADGIYQSSANGRQRYSLSMRYDEIGNIKRKEQTSLIDQLNNGSVTGIQDDSNASYRFNYNYTGSRAHAPSAIDEEHVGVPNTRRTLVYDADGNQKSWSFAPGASHTRELIWTEDGRIREVREDGFSKSQSRYDASGMRTRHVQAGSDMLYFGDTLTVGDRNRETKHVFVGGQRVASRVDYVDKRMSSRTFWYQSDHLQSTQFVTTADQKVEQHFEYIPTGETWVEDRPQERTLEPTYAFNGKELDEDTNSYNFGARQYDPRLSLWMSPDPILAGYMKGNGIHTPRNLGLYTYTWNNPVVLQDPDGNAVNVVAAAVGCVVGAACGAGARVISNVINDRPISEGVGAATIGGGVTGGLAGLTLGSSLLVSAAGAGLAATIGGGVSRGIETGDAQMSVQNTLTDFSIGAGMSLIAGALMTPGSPSVSEASSVPPVTEADLMEAEVEAAFMTGRVETGALISAPADGLVSGGPKQGQGAIWYHDNVTVKGAGPEGATVQVRTHSPNPNAPPGSYSRSNYTTQINSKDGRYLLPDGSWKSMSNMTPVEKGAAHYPAGN